MAERAHPDLLGFQTKWRMVLRRGYIPWIRIERSPYGKELFWRYKWVNHFCRNRDVLDIPCGMGWGTSLLKNCRRVVGVDIDREAIREARERYGKAAEFQVGNMAELDFAANSFDVVLCLEGIEHVTPGVAEAFIPQVRRVLRKEGMFFISSPCTKTGKHSGNPYHIKEYKPIELRTLLGSHFDIIDEVSREVDNLAITYFQARPRHHGAL